MILSAMGSVSSLGHWQPQACPNFDSSVILPTEERNASLENAASTPGQFFLALSGSKAWLVNSLGDKSKRFPIHWHIGKIDSRFNISAEQVKESIQLAINVWETEAGKRLFVFDKKSGFPVDFVFDSRQVVQRDRLEVKVQLRTAKKDLDNADQSWRAETERFKQAQAQVDMDVEAYKSRLKSYNRRVDDWNASGGAPPEVVAEFESEKRKLARQKKRLEQSQDEAEAIRVSANNYVQSYNEILVRYNQVVQIFNTKFSKSIKQRVGECLSSGSKILKISIYAFQDSHELTMILAHEFGHALGMRHVKGSTALMRAVEDEETQNTEIQVTAADRAELRRSLGG